MITPEESPEVTFWDWQNQDHMGKRDYLFVTDNALYFEGVVAESQAAAVKEAVDRSAIKERLAKETKERLRRPFARAIAFDKVEACEYVPLLTSHLLRIRYVDEAGKQQTLALKVPTKDDFGNRIFTELRARIAPTSIVKDQKASTWTAIRGPLGSIIFGGGFLSLMALGSISDERAWQERFSFVYALVGWLIRLLGPVWLTTIAVIWIGVSALILRSRLRNPPTIQVWHARPA